MRLHAQGSRHGDMLAYSEVVQVMREQLQEVRVGPYPIQAYGPSPQGHAR